MKCCYKMKKTFLSILCFFFIKVGFSQQDVRYQPSFDGDSEALFQMIDGYFSIEEIVTVSQANKSDLYQRAIRWTVIRYRSAKDVIQLEDSINSEIIVKGQLQSSCWKRKMDIDHTLNIMCKDGKYRVIVNQLFITIHNYVNGADYTFSGSIEKIKLTNKEKQQLFKCVREAVDNLLENINNSMQEKIKVKDDW